MLCSAFTLSFSLEDNFPDVVLLQSINIGAFPRAFLPGMDPLKTHRVNPDNIVMIPDQSVLTRFQFVPFYNRVFFFLFFKYKRLTITISWLGEIGEFSFFPSSLSSRLIPETHR